MGYFYPNGLSAKSGAHRLLTKPIYTSAAVRYVDSVNGDDSWNGTYNAPYATLGAADSAGRIVVVKTSSAEALTSALLLTAGSTVVGETSTAGVPDASMTNNAAATTMFTLSAIANVQFLNMRFPEQTQSCSASRITCSTTGLRFDGCRFEVDVKDTAVVLDSNGKQAMVDACTFVSTATSVADGAGAAFVDTAGNDFRSENCVVATGPYGIAADKAFNVSAGSIPKVFGAVLDADSVLASSKQAILGFGEGTDPGAAFWDEGDIGIDDKGVLASVGSDLVATSRVLSAASVFYVDSATGSDSNTGGPELPFATLAHAATQLGSGQSGDIVILRSGHTETITSTITLSATSSMVIAEDTSVTLSLGADTNGISISGAGVELRNITFDATAALGAATFIIASTIPATVIDGCQFNLDGNVAAAAVNFSASATYSRIRNTTFASTATLATARPNSAVRYAGGASPMLESVTFDGGSVGFSTYALDASSNSVAAVRFEDVTLLNGADAAVNGDSTGYIQVTSSATSTVDAFMKEAS